VFAKIARIFAAHKINLGSVIQHGEKMATVVPIVIMCGPTEEANIKRALKEVAGLGAVRAEPQFIRVEDFLEESGAEADMESVAPQQELATC
jgi:hypothetical protein